MINFTDTVPVDASKTYAHSITERSDGLYDIVYEAGELTDTPTELNRNSIMALQGMENAETLITIGSGTISVNAQYDDVTSTTDITIGSGVFTVENRNVADNGQEIGTDTTITIGSGTISVVKGKV